MQIFSINAIIFDFGGVLINWDPHRVFNKYFASDTQAVDAFLKEINFTAWNLSQDKGYPFTQAVRELSAQHPQYASLIQAYDEEWEQSISGIIAETAEILYRLKAAGCHLYGLTNWSAEKFAIVRHKYKVFDLFEEILVSGEVKLIKPDPAIYRLLLKKIKYPPEACLMIDDSATNEEASRKMGFVAVHFTSPEQLESEFRRLNVL